MPAKKSPAPVVKKGGKGSKKLTFTEAAKKAASTAVQSVRTAGAAAAAGKKKAVRFAGEMEGSGIVTAEKSRKRQRELEEAEPEEDEDVSGASVTDSDADAEETGSGSDADDLSDLADESSSGDDDDDQSDDDNPFIKSKRDGTKLSYPALRLRFLPPEFQEPQLFKFLDQFGAKVLNCFCVRSRRTHQSKGIAYVQFDKPSVLPIVVEECHGMALGGRSVQAKQVTLHRPMPSKEKVTRRRQLAYAYRTKGAPLKQHNVSAKKPIALLIKAARTEGQNNAHLAHLGIAYATDFFTAQLPKKAAPAPAKAAPKAPTKAEKTPVKAATPRADTEKKTPVKAATTATTPMKTPAKTPSRTPSKTPAKTPSKTPAKTPAKPATPSKASSPKKAGSATPRSASKKSK